MSLFQELIFPHNQEEDQESIILFRFQIQQFQKIEHLQVKQQ
jgi:hypothetical protein